jgi:hypothetical protein
MCRINKFIVCNRVMHFSGSAVKCNLVSMVCSTASGAQSIEQGALEICSGTRDAHDLSHRVFCIFIFSQAEAMDCLGTQATFLNIWGFARGFVPSYICSLCVQKENMHQKQVTRHPSPNMASFAFQ